MKKAVLKIWNYFKDSWEGEDGKFSYRRFSQYIFLFCMIYMAAVHRLNDQWQWYAFLTFGILYTIISLSITVQQLITLVKYTLPLALGRQVPPEPDPPAVEGPGPEVQINVTQKEQK